jgi:hypothetical protein
MSNALISASRFFKASFIEALDLWEHEMAFKSLIVMCNIDLERRPLFRPVFATDIDGPQLLPLFATNPEAQPSL